MAVEALSPDSVTLVTGDRWVVTVATYDDGGLVVDDVTPMAVATLPDGTTANPSVERVSAGVFRAVYPIAAPGRHVAVVTATGYGSAGFAAWADTTVAAPGMPTVVGDLLGENGYLGATSATEAEVQRALDAEAAAQRAVCRIGATYSADLREALLRRVARNLAMQGIPLAVLQGDADAGSAVLPGRDPEVRRLEGPHRKLVMG